MCREKHYGPHGFAGCCSPKDIAGIKRWLKLNEIVSTNRCPFRPHRPTGDCIPCLALFSRKDCPCGEYSYKYVRRVAKEVVKKSISW